MLIPYNLLSRENNQILKYLLLSGIDYHYVLKETPFSPGFLPETNARNAPFPENMGKTHAAPYMHSINGGGGGGVAVMKIKRRI